MEKKDIQIPSRLARELEALKQESLDEQLALQKAAEYVDEEPVYRQKISSVVNFESGEPRYTGLTAISPPNKKEVIKRRVRPEAHAAPVYSESREKEKLRAKEWESKEGDVLQNALTITPFISDGDADVFGDDVDICKAPPPVPLVTKSSILAESWRHSYIESVAAGHPVGFEGK